MKKTPLKDDASRAWKNFVKPLIRGKQGQIQIHHIRSHQGQATPEQMGNDGADKIAKIYMSEGENLDPLPYFTAAEETFLAFHEDDLIEGDIRLWLKIKEKELKRHFFYINILHISYHCISLPHNYLLLTNYTKDFGIGLNHRNPKMLLKKNINYH